MTSGLKVTGLKLAFAAVVVGGIAASWIYYSGSRAGANKNELQEVRRVESTKTGEGKVIDQKRLLAGKAAATSEARSDASRARYGKARRVLWVADSAGEIPPELKQPVADVIQHTDNVERENLDLRRLAFVDTTLVKNLTERLELKQKELELVPKAPRCGWKCGAVVGTVLTLAVIIAAGSSR